MTSVNDIISNNNKEILYKKVKRFIVDGKTKHLTGAKVVDGFLIFDIGNEQSIHINPDLKLVVMVDNLTWGNLDFSTDNNINVLNKFFTVLTDEIEKFYQELGKNLVDRITSSFISPKMDTISFYMRAELWYYKSLFSGHLATYCFNPIGAYVFTLSDNKILHVYISRVYLDDKGVYFIENRSQPVSQYSYEPYCSEELLQHLKELCKNPDNLHNLAQV